MARKISKLEARERIRRSDEARVAREQADMADAVTYTRALVQLAEVDVWEIECLAAAGDEVGDEVRAEAANRLALSLTRYGAAIKRMLDRGETLTTIAEFTGLDRSELRAVLPYAPKTGDRCADNS